MLDKNILKTGLVNAQIAARKAQTVEQAANIFAEQFAAAIDAFVRSGDVTVTVTTTGTATAQAGTGQGKVN